MRTLRYRLALWVLVVLLAAGSLPVHAQPAPQHTNTVHPYEEAHFVLDEDTGLGYVDNILVLFLKPGVDERTVPAWFPGEDARVVGRFPGLHQVQVRINPRGRAQLEQLAQALMQREQVLYAHLQLAHAVGGQQSALPIVTEEPFAHDDFPLPPPSQRKPQDEWWYQVIGLKQAQQLYKGGQYVKTGVVDDGFDTLHPGLRLAFVGSVQQRENLAEYHGTHVAGIVQQVMPGAIITVTDSYPVPDRQAHAHLGTLCTFAKHMVDMVEAGVRVLNYSMGMDLEDETMLAWHGQYAGMLSVYMHVLKQQGREFIIVQSAGNTGIDAYRNGLFCMLDARNCLGGQPAWASLGVLDNLAAAQQSVLDSIVVVGASGPKDNAGQYPLMQGSNTGNTVTIVAPGDPIWSTVPGGYQDMAGTSQAAPVVTGALGLLWSMRPELTAAQLKHIVVSTATDTAHLTPEGLAFAQLLAKEAAEKGTGTADAPIRTEYPVLNLLEAARRVLETP